MEMLNKFFMMVMEKRCQVLNFIELLNKIIKTL